MIAEALCVAMSSVLASARSPDLSGVIENSALNPSLIRNLEIPSRFGMPRVTEKGNNRTAKTKTGIAN